MTCDSYDSNDRYVVSWYTGQIEKSDFSIKNYCSGIGLPRKTFANNPNWRLKIARLENASQSYSLYHGEIDPPQQLTSTSKRMLGSMLYQNWWVTTNRHHQRSAADAHDKVLSDQALAKVKRKISNASSSMNVLVPIGEIREVRGLIRGLADSCFDLATTVYSLSKGKRPPKSLHKQASNMWLNWSFGVAPTFGEVSNLATTIADSLHGSPRKFRFTGTAEKTFQTSSPLETLVSTRPYGADLVGYADRRHTLSYRYVALFAQKISYYQDYDGLAQHLNVTPAGIIPAAWELLPYSWLIDYFTTAGAFLEDTFSTTGGTTISVVCDRKHTIESQITTFFRPWKPVPSDLRDFQTDIAHHKSREVYFDRSVMGSLPNRSLRLKTIDEVAVNSVNRLLNLLSLLGSRH